jgi:hypothetical protein
MKRKEREMSVDPLKELDHVLHGASRNELEQVTISTSSLAAIKLKLADARDRERRAYIEGWRKGHNTPQPTDCSDCSEWRYAVSEAEAVTYLEQRAAIEAAKAKDGAA